MSIDSPCTYSETGPSHDDGASSKHKEKLDDQDATRENSQVLLPFGNPDVTGTQLSPPRSDTGLAGQQQTDAPETVVNENSDVPSSTQSSFANTSSHQVDHDFDSQQQLPHEGIEDSLSWPPTPPTPGLSASDSISTGPQSYPPSFLASMAIEEASWSGALRLRNAMTSASRSQLPQEAPGPIPSRDLNHPDFRAIFQRLPNSSQSRSTSEYLMNQNSPEEESIRQAVMKWYFTEDSEPESYEQSYESLTQNASQWYQTQVPRFNGENLSGWIRPVAEGNPFSSDSSRERFIRHVLERFDEFMGRSENRAPSHLIWDGNRARRAQDIRSLDAVECPGEDELDQIDSGTYISVASLYSGATIDNRASSPDQPPIKRPIGQSTAGPSRSQRLAVRISTHRQHDIHECAGSSIGSRPASPRQPPRITTPNNGRMGQFSAASSQSQRQGVIALSHRQRSFLERNRYNGQASASSSSLGPSSGQTSAHNQTRATSANSINAPGFAPSEPFAHRQAREANSRRNGSASGQRQSRAPANAPTGPRDDRRRVYRGYHINGSNPFNTQLPGQILLQDGGRGERIARSTRR